MDAHEFLKKVAPAAQRSRLAPFWNDIATLRENDCTLEQVRAFLAANGVQISIAGLSKYIKRREEGKAQPSRSTPAAAAPQVQAPTESGQTAETRRITNPADIRKARNREINLEDFSNPEKE